MDFMCLLNKYIYIYIQGDQLYIWPYVSGISDLVSVNVYTGHFLQGTKKNKAMFMWSPCI